MAVMEFCFVLLFQLGIPIKHSQICLKRSRLSIQLIKTIKCHPEVTCLPKYGVIKCTIRWFQIVPNFRHVNLHVYYSGRQIYWLYLWTGISDVHFEIQDGRNLTYVIMHRSHQCPYIWHGMFASCINLAKAYVRVCVYSCVCIYTCSMI